MSNSSAGSRSTVDSKYPAKLRRQPRVFSIDSFTSNSWKNLPKQEGTRDGGEGEHSSSFMDGWVDAEDITSDSVLTDSTPDELAEDPDEDESDSDVDESDSDVDEDEDEDSDVPEFFFPLAE